ncbi:MAG: lytic transglycosylase domain-containing protein [Desulfobacterales bacterium]
MSFREDKPPWRRRLDQTMGWLFAVALALMVSIADIRLSAERDELDDEAVAIPVPLQATAFGSLSASGKDQARFTDLSGTVFEPSGEPTIDPYHLIIHEAAGRYDVAYDLIRAVIMVESEFNPRAVSRRGARGLMQLMPVTASELDVKNLHDPAENINAGVRYIRSLLDRFDGDVELALAAYNAGPGNVQRYDGIPPYKETHAFIAKVLGYYEAIRVDSVEF